MYKILVYLCPVLSLIKLVVTIKYYLCTYLVKQAFYVKNVNH